MITNSLKWIVKYEGSVVPDDELRRHFDTGESFGDVIRARDGHRARTAKRALLVKPKWGGSRKRTLAIDDYGGLNIHPDASKGKNSRSIGLDSSSSNITSSMLECI